MKIKKIAVKNFKSFQELSVDLGDFNVVIGPNASGKSNFIHIFEFLRDIQRYGLENAISMQGDSEFLKNIMLAGEENLSVEVTSAPGEDEIVRSFGSDDKHGFKGFNIKETRYRFTLGFPRRKGKFKIVAEEYAVKFALLKQHKQREKKGEVWSIAEIKKKEKQGEGVYSLKRDLDHNDISVDIDIPAGSGINEDDFFPFFRILKDSGFLKKRLMLEAPFFGMIEMPESLLQNIQVYNIDPRQGKKAAPITGKSELEEDGSNLAIVLKKILADQEIRRRFTNLLNDVLAFVEDIEVQKFADRSLLVHLKETYSKEKLLPAFLLSEGTLNITALITALYFERKPFIIIEEPERNIHPYLVSKVVAMMQEVSKKKQIIITTHNPEILKHARLEDILFISRDKKGFSQVTRPAENGQVKIFLENEMGIDELYIQNLLG